ncbi:response regulator transcription factor [Bosea sp. 2KB_26]|uniref:response regulator transcription factor n=1 Tax=Bosea sp. 2KB_26 TaxID=3237475 RepID=UPI003F8E4B42
MDDDPSVVKSLSRTLRVHAFQTKAYRSAREFLAALPNGTPACLIVDVQMPGMTGLELIHHLTTAGIHIPTIVITAQSDLRVRERPEAAGVIAILSKPLRNTALIAAIDAAIGTEKDPDQEPS